MKSIEVPYALGCCFSTHVPHYLQNKVGAFLADLLLHRILTQPRSAFDLRAVMDEGKILLINLAEGKIGENTTTLLGALLVARVGLAALSRADGPPRKQQV